MLVTISAIEKSIENKQIRTLSFYYCLKSQYQNSTFYNYTPEKIQKDLSKNNIKISINTIRKYIGVLKAQELVRKHNNNLTVVSSSLIKGSLKRFTIIKRDKNRNLAETEAILIAKLLKHKIQQHKYSIIKQGKETYLKKKTKLSLDQIDEKTKSKLLRYQKKEICHVIIGLRKLSEKMNLSIDYLRKIIKMLISKGLLEVKKHLYNSEKLPKFIKKQLNFDENFKFVYTFNVKNSLLCYFGCEYFF